MKRVIFALVLSMSLISAIAGFSEQIATTKASTDPLEVGVVTEGCQLAVHAVKQKPQQEQPIKLIIVRSNVSDNDMSFSARMPQYDYHFDIKDGHRIVDPSGLNCENDVDAVAKAKLFAIKVALERPEIDLKRHIAVLNAAGDEISKVPVYSQGEIAQ